MLWGNFKMHGMFCVSKLDSESSLVNEVKIY